MRARASLFATIAVVALGACKDSGLPDKNLPIDEAAHRPPDALVQAVHPGTRPGAQEDTHGAMAGGADPSASSVRIGEQTFMPAGTPIDIDPASLRQVGASGGMSFLAARGEEAPYDHVYMTHPGGRYITYVPVHDASGDPDARQATMEHNLESAGGH